MILVNMDYWTIHHRRRGHYRKLELISGGIIFSCVLFSVNAGTSTSSYSKQYTSSGVQSFTQPQNQHQNLLNAAAVSSGNTSSDGYYATADAQQVANLSPPLLPGAPGTFEPRGDIGGGYGGGGFGGGGGYGGGGGGWGGGGGGYGESPAVYKYQVYPNPVSKQI